MIPPQDYVIRRGTYGHKGFRRRFQSEQNSNTDLEYEIDPITNRKVFKNKSSETTRRPIEIPVKTLKGYRSQFQDLAPPASNSTQQDIKTFSSPDQSDPARERPKGYKKNITTKTFLRNEVDGKKPDAESDGPNEEALRASYEGSQGYEPDRNTSEKPSPVEEGLKDYDSRTSYGPVMYREPDGKLPEKPDLTRESLKDYEDNHPYGPVMYREPDGKLPEKPDPIRESLKDYEDNHPYGPVMYREPDGKLPEQPCPVQEGLKEYDDKVTYGPVLYNEPNGKPQLERDTVGEGLGDSDKRAEHGPGRISKNVFLGGGKSNTDRSFRYPTDTDTREDLDLLRPSDVRAASGIIKSTRKETEAEKLAVREKLENEFQTQQYLQTSLAEDLEAINKTMESGKLDDMSNSGQMLQKKLKEVTDNLTYVRGRIDAKLAEVSEDSSSTPPQRKITGHFVQDFPEEFEARWTSEGDSKTLMPKVETVGGKVDNKNVDGVTSKETFSRSPNTPRIQTSLDRSIVGPHQKDSKKIDWLQNEKDPYSKEPMGLETNYLEELERERLELERDPFSKKPMGLETSYTDELAQVRKLELQRDPYSKEPMGLETSYADEISAQQAEGDLSAPASSYGTAKCNSGGNNKTQNSKKDKKAKKALFKQMDQDLVREVRQIYEEKYGTISYKHRQVPETSTASEPTTTTDQYIILDYDDITKEIKTTYTTSVVTDMTPEEILLRSSNPERFSPYFEQLQARGWEVVCGSPDMLVFREVEPNTFRIGRERSQYLSYSPGLQENGHESHRRHAKQSHGSYRELCQPNRVCQP